jgi:hypothetical protein
VGNSACLADRAASQPAGPNKYNCLKAAAASGLIVYNMRSLLNYVELGGKAGKTKKVIKLKMVKYASYISSILRAVSN